MKLRGNSRSRDGDAIIYKELLSQEDISRLFIMGVDGGGQAAEIRSKRGGFRLNLDNRKTIRELAIGLQMNPDLCFFLSNHINVDATARGHSGRLLSYRRDNGHYWESIACPITVTPLSFSTDLTSFRGRIVASSIDDGYLPYSLEASILCDLMTVHDVMRSATHLHLSDLGELTNILSKSNLEAWRKEDFYHPQNQETIARVLIYQAKEMKRADIIPAILRLQKSKTLPDLGAFSKAITSLALGNSNFSEVVQRFSGYNDETVSNFVGRALADGQAIAMSPVIRSILKSNGEWSGYIIDRLEAQDINDPTIREILATNTYSLSSRKNLAAKVREFDYNEESKDLFENPNIPLEVKLTLGGKVSTATRADFAPIARQLQDHDWGLLIQSINNSIRENLDRREITEILQKSIKHNHNSLERSFLLNEDVSDILLLSSTPTNIKNLIAKRLVTSGIDARIINLLEKTNKETAQILERKVAEYYENQPGNIELTIEVARFIELASALGHKAVSTISSKLIPAAHGFNKLITARNFIVNDKIPLDLRMAFVRNCNFTIDEDLKVLLVNDRIPENLRVEIVRKLEINTIDANVIDLLGRFSRSNHVVQAIKRKFEDHFATLPDNSIPFDERITKLYAIQSRLFSYVPFEGLIEKLECDNLNNQNIVNFLNNSNINSRERQSYLNKLRMDFDVTVAQFLTNGQVKPEVRRSVITNLEFDTLNEHLATVFANEDCYQNNIVDNLNSRLAAVFTTREDDSIELTPAIVALFGTGRVYDGTARILIQKLKKDSLTNPLVVEFLSHPKIPSLQKQKYSSKLSSNFDATVAQFLTNGQVKPEVRRSVITNLEFDTLNEHLATVFANEDCYQNNIVYNLNGRLAAVFTTREDDSIELTPAIVALFGTGRVYNDTARILIQKIRGLALDNELIKHFINHSKIAQGIRNLYKTKCASAV